MLNQAFDSFFGEVTADELNNDDNENNSGLSSNSPVNLFPGELNEGGDDATKYFDADADDTATIETMFDETKPKKGTTLLNCYTDAQVTRMCCGMIGGANKFCIRDIIPGTTNCGIASHSKSKFEMKVNHFYIKKTETSALCTPCVHLNQVPESELLTFKMNFKTVDEWKDEFDILNNIPVEDDKDLVFERKKNIAATGLAPKTPAKVKQVKIAKSAQKSKLPFAPDGNDLPDDYENDWNSLPKDFLQHYLYNHNLLRDHSTVILGFSRDVEGLTHLSEDIGQDLDRLDSRLNTLNRRLGSSTVKEDVEGQTVWSAIEQFERLVNPLPPRLHALEQLIVDIPESLTKLQTEVNLQRNEVNIQKNTWVKMTPFLRQVRELVKASMKHSPSSLDQRLSALESRFGSSVPNTVKRGNVSSFAAQQVFNPVPPPTAPTTSTATFDPSGVLKATADLESKVKGLQDAVDLLKARTSGDGVKIGRFSFQSPEELATWVQTNIAGYRFGYYVDGVSLWEFFYADQQNLPNFVSGYHHTSRIGFNTLYEAKVATSFQNVLPSTLGRGTDTTKFLPGLAKAEKWDSLDGASGLKYQISRDLPGVMTQISQNITSSASTQEGKDLAQLCLQNSTRFVSDMSNWVSRAYMELTASKSYTPDQCWALISRCIKRLFNDLADGRVTAKDVLDSSNELQTATQYLWATLKTHQIMEEYMKSNFEDHPAFASVITRFVTNNSFQSDYKTLLGRVDKVDTAAKKCNSRIDKLYTGFDLLEARVKALEEKSFDFDKDPVSGPSSSPAPSTFTEHLQFRNSIGSYIIICENWPSWLSPLLATGTQPSAVYSSADLDHSSFFRGTYKNPWFHFSELTNAAIDSSAWIFLSGSTDFILRFYQRYQAPLSCAVIEGVQPHLRRLQSIPLHWHRLKHTTCGGVSSGSYWCGTPLSLSLGPTPSSPKRRLHHILNAATRCFQSTVPSQDHISEQDSVMSCFEDSYHSQGLYPVSLPHAFLITGSVFTLSKWCRRRISSKELCDVFDQPVYIQKSIESLPSSACYNTFFSGIPAKILHVLIRRVGLLSFDSSPLTTQAPSLAPILEVPPDYDPEHVVSAKHDDARIASELWDERVIAPFHHLDTPASRTTALDSLPVLRRFFLRVWKRKVIRSFHQYLGSTYGLQWRSLPMRHDPNSDLSQDIVAFADVSYYVLNTTWFEWPAGSRLFFWRWHPLFRRKARDGVPFCFVKPKPKVKRPQSVPADPSFLAKVREKLAKVRRRSYVAPGFVKSLIRYFAVPKGESDIRMVYDGTSSGFNDSIWVPSFGLPVIESVLRSTDTDTWMADIDVADQFLNFVLHEDAQPYCGVDLSPYFSDECSETSPNLWERWTRCLMGAKSSPYQTIRAMLWAEDIIRGDRLSESNPLQWKYIRLNLPGSVFYDPTLPWVSKVRSDGILASDFYIYVDDCRSTSPSLDEAWHTLRRISSILGYLGIQDAARKRRPPTKRPGAWAGSMVYLDSNNVGVYVSHEKWKKVKDHLSWITEQVRRCRTGLASKLEMTNWGIEHKELERRRGFLVYVSRTYPSITPYLKGIHHTLDSWREGRDSDGWKEVMQELRSSEKVESAYTHPSSAPDYVFPVPRLDDDLSALNDLFSGEHPRVRVVRSKCVSIALYGFGDASGSGFGSTIELKDKSIKVRYGLWGKDSNKLSSNYRELSNLVETIETEAKEGTLSGSELFLFTDNAVAEACFYKGTSDSKTLFDLVLRIRKVQLKYSLRLHVIHVAGTRMIQQGTDGTSRGNFLEGVMMGQDMLSFVPLNESAIERSPDLKEWMESWTQEDLVLLSPEGWFTTGHGIVGGENNADGEWIPQYASHTSIWAPPPAAAFDAMAELIRSRHKNPNLAHIFVCPRLFTHAWRKGLMKTADCCFYVAAGSIPQWPAEMHEPLMIGVFLPFISSYPWQLRRSEPVLEVERELREVWKRKDGSERLVLRKLWSLRTTEGSM